MPSQEVLGALVLRTLDKAVGCPKEPAMMAGVGKSTPSQCPEENLMLGALSVMPDESREKKGNESKPIPFVLFLSTSSFGDPHPERPVCGHGRPPVGQLGGGAETGQPSGCDLATRSPKTIAAGGPQRTVMGSVFLCIHWSSGRRAAPAYKRAASAFGHSPMGGLAVLGGWMEEL